MSKRNARHRAHPDQYIPRPVALDALMSDILDAAEPQYHVEGGASLYHINLQGVRFEVIARAPRIQGIDPWKILAVEVDNAPEN